MENQYKIEYQGDIRVRFLLNSLQRRFCSIMKKIILSGDIPCWNFASTSVMVASDGLLESRDFQLSNAPSLAKNTALVAILLPEASSDTF